MSEVKLYQDDPEKGWFVKICIRFKRWLLQLTLVADITFTTKKSLSKKFTFNPLLVVKFEFERSATFYLYFTNTVISCCIHQKFC